MMQLPTTTITFLHQKKENGNEPQHMTIAEPDALLKNYHACKISRFASAILYCPMLSFPETIIQQTQSKLFTFLSKNTRDKVKRPVLYRPLSKGGLSFPSFTTVMKALRLSWMNTLLNNTRDTWQSRPKNPPQLFYQGLLNYFEQLRSNY